jgi:hypothetical protein
MGIRERNVMVSQSVSFVAVPPTHSTTVSKDGSAPRRNVIGIERYIHASWRVAFLVRFFGFDMFAAARAYQISGRNVCQGNLTLVGILTSARMIRPCANAGVQ